jgi:hypothetical protein
MSAMDIQITTPNGPIDVSGSGAAIGWLLLNLPEAKANKPKAKRTRKTYSEDDKARIVAEGLKAKASGRGGLAAFLKTEGINAASFANWTKAAKKTKK